MQPSSQSGCNLRDHAGDAPLPRTQPSACAGFRDGHWKNLRVQRPTRIPHFGQRQLSLSARKLQPARAAEGSQARASLDASLLDVPAAVLSQAARAIAASPRPWLNLRRRAPARASALRSGYESPTDRQETCSSKPQPPAHRCRHRSTSRARVATGPLPWRRRRFSASR
eukprot:366251-Chlamydomonas_euryale.AAC.4